MSNTHRIPAGSMTKQPLTNFQAWDIEEAANEQIKDHYVRARVLNNLAWRVDTMIVSRIRQVYRAMSEEMFVTGTIEEYNQAVGLLKEMEFAEKMFGEIGSSIAGPMTSFAQLVAYRPTAIIHALDSAEHVEEFWRYKEGSIEAKLHEKPRVSVSARQAVKMEESVNAYAMFGRQMGQEITEEVKQAMLESKRKRALFKQQQLADSSSQRAPALEVIYTIMESARQEFEGNFPFHKLDLADQEMLINSSMNAATLCIDSAEEDRTGKLNSTMVTMQALFWEHHCKNVFNSPKFKAYRAEAQAMAARLEPTAAKAPVSPEAAASRAAKASEKAEEADNQGGGELTAKAPDEAPF